MTGTLRGVSNKHCLLSFFHFPFFWGGGGQKIWVLRCLWSFWCHFLNRMFHVFFFFLNQLLVTLKHKDVT